ncbi:hypothetical protein HPP92_000061 [Vanilla planifolia]|uniref:VQ domain-containing protein n=1 Tax=Vanilla planifolia TaxID=51239 RepID=A0A835VGN0_VANPL|nr:hypothetical protein HPP92_000062 [Vanilla planifolia]KAG0499989.1 hypothetical protein HPP92_000061 [Vanilla planifolia]
MDLFEQAGGRPSPRRGIQLQGPRPTVLKLNKDSHKIKKPSHQPTPPEQHRRPPVIIYTVSPKVIHTKPSEFMSLVQRLTGCPSSSAAASAAEDHPSDENGSREEDTNELRRVVGGGTVPGFSSPISPNLFSPSAVGGEMSPLNFFQELNSGLHGGKAAMENGFMANSGNLFFSL